MIYGKRIVDFPFVHLLLVIVAAIFAAEAICTIATGQIWWPF